MTFLVHWLVAAVAVAITAYLLPGVRLSGFPAALITALVLGFFNSFIRPVLLFLTLPVTILTLGLFTLIINAVIILVTSAVVPGFEVRSFWSAILFSIVLTVINWLLTLVVW